MKMPRFRIDDVLQVSRFSPAQQGILEVRPFFDLFVEATKTLENEPIILAVVASGTTLNPRWVEFIKEHKNWEIQCHCWEHEVYTRLSPERAVEDLKRAKEAIENAFECKVTKFYPPKLKYNQVTKEAARIAGMEEIRLRWRPIHWLKDPSCCDEVFFHFWDLGHVSQVRKIQEIARNG